MQNKHFQNKLNLFLLVFLGFAYFMLNANSARASSVICEQMPNFTLQSSNSPCTLAPPRDINYTGPNAAWALTALATCNLPVWSAIPDSCGWLLSEVQSRVTQTDGCCYKRNDQGLLNYLSYDYVFSPGEDLSTVLADLIDPSTAPPPISSGPVIVPIPPTGLRAKISNEAIRLNPNVSSIGGIISTFLNYAFVIAGLILFIMIIWGGFEMLSGAGDPKAQEAAKKRITASALGFILLFASYWIMQILGIVTGASFF